MSCICRTWRIHLFIQTFIKISYLCSEVIVEQFESCKLLIHGLGVLRLLFLHNLATCFYHCLHFKLHLTQQLVQFLYSKNKGNDCRFSSVEMGR